MHVHVHKAESVKITLICLLKKKLARMFIPETFTGILPSIRGSMGFYLTEQPKVSTLSRDV